MTPDAAKPERTAAYRLLSRLLLEGATPALLPTLRSLPPLAAGLVEPWDPDQAAAEHYRVLGRQVPPYAGVFLEESGRVGGRWARLVVELAREAGAPLPERSEEPDHVGRILELLAEVGDGDAAVRILDRALLPWLPWLVEAVERVDGAGIHAAAARLTLDLALDHREALGGRGVEGDHGGPPTDPLDDRRAGLRDVARFLVNPARSGLYVALEDVRTLAAGRFPTGFGDRSGALETLLRSASTYGGLAQVLDGLRKMVEAGERSCERMMAERIAAVSAAAEERLRRLELTRSVLDRLGEAGG